MPAALKFLTSVAILSGVGVAVGFLLSGDDALDWELTALLVGVAIVGEGLRTWIRRGRRRRQSAGA